MLCDVCVKLWVLTFQKIVWYVCEVVSINGSENVVWCVCEVVSIKSSENVVCCVCEVVSINSSEKVVWCVGEVVSINSSENIVWYVCEVASINSSENLCDVCVKLWVLTVQKIFVFCINFDAHFRHLFFRYTLMELSLWHTCGKVRCLCMDWGYSEFVVLTVYIGRGFNF